MAVDHYENFPVASMLVPRRLRPAILAIYRFARGADDIADEGEAEPDARLASLAEYGHRLDAIAVGETPAEPPFPALAAVIRQHALPLAPFHDLLSAFSQDVTQTRYASYAQLVDYCRRSANPVGHLLLHLYGRAQPANLLRSDAICTGLQLANFWQDVSVDWGKGRVYLPQEDLRRYDLREADIATGRAGPVWARLLAFEGERTRALLNEGRPLASELPLRLRLELRLVVAGGLRILDKLDAVRGDVFRHRPVLGAFDWLRMAGAALAP